MDVKTNGSVCTFDEIKKSCRNCYTTKTPLWRGGPAGPRSLCNACGIRYRKTKKAMLLGLNDGKTEKRSGRKKSKETNDNIHQVSSVNLMMSMGEEEQAAMLLMSLSCASVYA